ncbi:MAG TPA: hypothetical protein VGD14_09505 [bacterium]
MAFRLLSYTEIDGIRTAADSDIKKLWERTVADGLDKIVFYEGTIWNAEQFLKMVKHPGAAFYFIFDGVDNIGYVWLNRFENRTARQHFCVFKEYWGKTLDVGKFVLDEIMNMKNQDGEFILDLLTGFVPVWNEKAIKFSMKCGGKTYGTIPNAIFNGHTGKSEDAFFIYYTRGAVNEDS